MCATVIRRTLLVVVALLALAGCGRFQRASDVETTTTAVPTTLSPLETTTTAGRPAKTTPTTRPPAKPCAAANRASVDHSSGFRLVVDVGDKVCYGARDEFTLTLQIQNPTDRPLYYDPNQEGFFDIIPENNAQSGSWSDRSCRTRVQETVRRTGALVLGPGETATRATALYPAPKSQSNREDCRFLEGTYAVIATLTYCQDSQCKTTGSAESPHVRIRVS
jgi:hypothetical protein